MHLLQSGFQSITCCHTPEMGNKPCSYPRHCTSSGFSALIGLTTIAAVVAHSHCIMNICCTHIYVHTYIPCPLIYYRYYNTIVVATTTHIYTYNIPVISLMFCALAMLCTLHLKSASTSASRCSSSLCSTVL